MALDRETTIRWYGHACVEVETPGGKRVLLDPWFGNPKSPRQASSVDRCDVMLVTHGHSDHMGDAVQIASRTRPAWPCIHEMSLWLARRLPGGADATIGFNKGGTVETGGLKVTMVTAVHSSGDWNAQLETLNYLGDPAGFVVELESGYRIYHAGDTMLMSDMRVIGELWHPDLAMLPIGGHYTMDPRQAAYAIEMLGVTDVMPIHYGTYPILAGTPDQLREELSKRNLGNVAVHAPEPGGTVQ